MVNRSERWQPRTDTESCVSDESPTSQEDDEPVLRPLEDGNQNEETDEVPFEQMQQLGLAYQVRPHAGIPQMEEQ